jgi:hypothetical protein
VDDADRLESGRGECAGRGFVVYVDVRPRDVHAGGAQVREHDLQRIGEEAAPPMLPQRVDAADLDLARRERHQRRPVAGLVDPRDVGDGAVPAPEVEPPRGVDAVHEELGGERLAAPRPPERDELLERGAPDVERARQGPGRSPFGEVEAPADERGIVTERGTDVLDQTPDSPEAQAVKKGSDDPSHV